MCVCIYVCVLIVCVCVCVCVCVWVPYSSIGWTRGISTTRTGTVSTVLPPGGGGVLILPYKVLLLYGGTIPQGPPFQLL